jgi:cation transport protein ChaC
VTETSDSFRHVPALRGLITAPETSRFRKLDYDWMDRERAANGFPPNWRRSHEEREATRAEALAGRLDGDLWIFAYGSLMWDPAVHFSEVRRATANGYRRRFCLESNGGRGSPQTPGLMAGLDYGGFCEGLVFRIEAALVDQETEILWQREMIMRGYAPTFIATKTPQGEVEALAFVVLLDGPHYLPDITLDEAAPMIAAARGFFGSNLEYLDNLAEHFQAMEIHDEDFVRLYGQAREIAGQAG